MAGQAEKLNPAPGYRGACRCTFQSGSDATVSTQTKARATPRVPSLCGNRLALRLLVEQHGNGSVLPHILSDVKDRVRASGSLSLFLDFDGTLVPILADPSAPRLDPDTAETLRLLSSRDFLSTTIISGRAVEDLYSRIRLPGLIYAGNHGLEIFGRNLRFVEPVASSRRDQLERLCEGLSEQLQSVAGAFVEFKGLTAAVHYRLAAPGEFTDIQRSVYTAVARDGALFRVNPGRKVFEIVPRTDWHKGEAVRWINCQLGGKETSSIYLGDDTSDEAAFSVLQDSVTIRVGPARATCARYHLPDPAAVHEFLLWLTLQEPARA